jgi:sugar-specific transcriptional regulator TrmB
MDTKPLKELGFTKNEIEIYSFLIKNGSTTTGPIIRETGIANSRVYESINSLVKKGFVSYNIQKDGKHFTAANPEIILDKEKERQKGISELVKQLSSLKKTEEETTMAIYEGFEGFKTAFSKIIEDCPKNEEIKITGFSEIAYEIESLRTFLISMNLKSASKKQKLKILVDSSVKKDLINDRKKEKYTEIRSLPEGYMSPAAMDIFLDYVYIFLWEEKPYVFMIKNKKIADNFKKYHEFLWKIAKKI